MTKQEDVDNLVAKTVEAYGGSIDILVNVVGGLVARKTLAEVELDWFENVMRLNLSSAFMTTKAVVPYRNRASSPGTVSTSTAGCTSHNPSVPALRRRRP